MGLFFYVIPVCDLILLWIDFELDSDDKALLEELGYGPDCFGSFHFPFPIIFLILTFDVE